MNKKKNFTTLFIDCPNIGIVKDVGQIPYYLSKKDIESVLVSSYLNMNGLHVDKVPGMKIVNIPLLLANITLTGIVYILKNAKKIDILNLYHCRRNTYILSKLYKLLNTTGVVYVKLDSGYLTVEQLNTSEKYRQLFRKMSNVADVISAESEVAVELLMPFSSKRIELIPNGITKSNNKGRVKRSDIFITVGRIGSPEKNHDILLEAFSRICDRCDWNLMFVGKIEDDFKDRIKDFYDKNQTLRDRVTFVGEVCDRNELFKLYKSAKVFLLPSKFENFSLACVEALECGCYLILSDQVTPNKDFTNNGEFGIVIPVDNVDALVEGMLSVTEMHFDEAFSDEIIAYTDERFLWDNICDKLYDLLMVK